MMTSVLIPAHNEKDFLPACLEALVAAHPVEGGVEVIVMANGCSDNTVALAQGFQATFERKGWVLKVLDLPQGGKLGALNAGEAAAAGQALIYIDADVQVSPPLIAQIATALQGAAPRYASGRPEVTVNGGWWLQAYTRFWRSAPFMTHGVPGFGVFAMNRAGRARWGAWPDIISDDTYARLNFTPEERISVPASFAWPMISGFGPLVRVRRRQDVGVAEVAEHFPDLPANDDSHEGAMPLWRRALLEPVGFVVFCAVRLAVHLPFWRSGTRWARGR